MLGKRFMARTAKDFVTQQGLRGLSRAARKRLGRVDWDRALFNRAGLQRMSTARSAASGVTLFCLGALSGAMLALMLAPKPGSELRSQVRSRAQGMMGGGRPRFQQAPAEA